MDSPGFFTAQVGGELRAGWIWVFKLGSCDNDRPLFATYLGRVIYHAVFEGTEIGSCKLHAHAATEAINSLLASRVSGALSCAASRHSPHSSDCGPLVLY